MDKECPNHDMQCYVHRRVPWTDSCSEWTLDTSTTTLDLIRPGDQAKCSLCQDDIEEVPSRRETASVVVGVITSGVPQSRQQGHLVLFSEEWIPHLRLGRMYHVIGQVGSLTQLYSVDFSQSRISVKKCLFNKRTIKVCVICC